MMVHNPQAPYVVQSKDTAGYMRLRETMSREQIEQIVEMICVLHGLAVERNCPQTLTLEWNEKGFLRRINGSNNIHPAKLYNAE